jgi:transposase
MFALSSLVRVYVAREPVDFRRGIDSLHALVRDGFGDDPLSGHLFLFFNRARDRLKVIGERLPTISVNCHNVRMETRSSRHAARVA